MRLIKIKLLFSLFIVKMQKIIIATKFIFVKTKNNLFYIFLFRIFTSLMYTNFN